jgi:hypothetical protein
LIPFLKNGDWLLFYDLSPQKEHSWIWPWTSLFALKKVMYTVVQTQVFSHPNKVKVDVVFTSGAVPLKGHFIKSVFFLLYNHSEPLSLL